MSITGGTARPLVLKMLRWPALTAAVFLLWPAPSSNGPSANALEKNSARTRQDSVPITSSDNLFEFHSGFWINLHHFLYEQAAIATAGPKGTPHEAELATDASMTAGLSEDESKVWSDALVYYRAKMLHHDLASDDDMVKIKNRLEDIEDATSADRSDLDPKLVAILDEAAPIYRTHWWFLHDKANQAWIAAVTPLVDNQGAGLAQQIATAFETEWPERPLRVDVVAYANYAGSYTTLRPTRITISSIDGGNQGTAALEVLFHAASDAMIDTISATVDRAYERAKRDPPPEITPMILWFTTGFLVKQLYPNYTPYADRFALWVENSQTGYRAALVRYWQPRLEGKMTLDAALAQLAANFWVTSAPEKKPPVKSL
ncbi:MAG: hypothetical protein WA581_20625 [Candidatus Acidiferrales bacterium]